MGDRFHAGESLPSLSASWLNRVSRAADVAEQRQAEQNVSGIESSHPHLRCTVQNTTGGDVADFHVFGLGDLRVVNLSTDPQQLRRKLVFDGEAPVKATHGTNFAVAYQPIKDGREGAAVIVGLTPVRINVTDAGHGFAVIDDADATRLASNASEGVPVVWKESGTGEKWGVVNLGSASGGGGASHSSVTVVTDVRVDSSGMTVDKKTRTVEVVNPGTESGWTTIHTGTDCE